MTDDEKTQVLNMLCEKIKEMIEATENNFRVVSKVLKDQRDKILELEAKVYDLQIRGYGDGA